MSAREVPGAATRRRRGPLPRRLRRPRGRAAGYASRPRAHAAEWHIKSDRIGVIGYSAGGQPRRPAKHAPPTTRTSSPRPPRPTCPPSTERPATPAPISPSSPTPAYLAVKPDEKDLDPVYAPNKFTPPTFVMQAENDKSYGHNALVYYRALMGRPRSRRTALLCHWRPRLRRSPRRHPPPNTGPASPPSGCTPPAFFPAKRCVILTMPPQPTSAAARSPAPSTRNPSRRAPAPQPRQTELQPGREQ